MLTSDLVMQALSSVQDPELGRDLVSLNMIRDLVIKDDTIAFTLQLTIPGCPLKDHMAKDARETLLSLPGVHHVHIEFGSMTVEERKAAHLLNRLDIPIQGMVENMSYFRCPGCQEEYSIFGPSHSTQLATDFNTTLVAHLPVDPDIAELCDRGKVEQVQLPEMADLAGLILAMPKSVN